MALFYQHNINADSRLGIWHIAENEDFFKKEISIQKEITHPHKRLQHYAGRYLLKVLDPDFPVADILLDGNRPYLENNHFYFSISHWQNFAAAIVSRSQRVGIDIEGEAEKLETLQKKYMTDEELQHLLSANHSIPLRKLLCICWSSKETMFKWYQKGKVDFREDMIVSAIHEKERTLSTLFRKEKKENLTIQYHSFGKMILTYLHT